MISTTAEFNYSMISTTAEFNYSRIQLQQDFNYSRIQLQQNSTTAGFNFRDLERCASAGRAKQRGVFIIHVCGHLPMAGSLYAGTCSG